MVVVGEISSLGAIRREKPAAENRLKSDEETFIVKI